jgi:hypothetical protein
MRKALWAMTPGLAVVLGTILGLAIAYGQEKKPDPPAEPKSIPVEFQNKILKLQLHQQQVAAEYQQCSTRIAAIPQEFNLDNAKIGQASDEALKEMKLDTEHWTVDVKAMTAIPKTAPEAPKEEKKP